MLEKLAFIEQRYQELSEKINDPEVIADQEQWQKLMREHADITSIVRMKLSVKRKRF